MSQPGSKGSPRSRDNVDPHRCTGCLKQVERVTADGYCDTCLRYSWGYDQAEEKVAVAMITAAVRGARDADVDPAMIVTAVQEALEEQLTADLGIPMAAK